MKPSRKRLRVQMTISPELVEWLDAMAASQGVTRSAYAERIFRQMRENRTLHTFHQLMDADTVYQVITAQTPQRPAGIPIEPLDPKRLQYSEHNVQPS